MSVISGQTWTGLIIMVLLVSMVGGLAGRWRWDKHCFGFWFTLGLINWDLSFEDISFFLMVVVNIFFLDFI